MPFQKSIPINESFIGDNLSQLIGFLQNQGIKETMYNIRIAGFPDNFEIRFKYYNDKKDTKVKLKFINGNFYFN